MFTVDRAGSRGLKSVLHCRELQLESHLTQSTEIMSGKQAKTLAANHIDDLLLFAETTRHPARDRVIVLLSVKAGLRAARSQT